MNNDFRDYVPGPDFHRIQGASTRDHYTHGAHAMTVPFVQDFVGGWRDLYREPFCGITHDGKVQQDLFDMKPEGIPATAMAAAAREVLNLATADERARLSHDIGADEWRIWSNPEWYVHPVGLRLEEIRPVLRDAILSVLRASLSPKGYDKARACMVFNGFLGEIVNARGIMNEYSYNFSLFGEPSLTEPWGWQLFGHHLVLNCFVLGQKMVMSPTFMGAEPNTIDAGPYAGLSLFQDEERVGLDLMRSLSPGVRQRAQVYKRQHDPAMPGWRWHIADQQIQGGAFQDNRVVPYEGVTVADFDRRQRQQIVDLVGHFIDYLPDGPLGARLADVERHLDQTNFSWIGGFGDEDPFYYRIQGPVLMVEFDHHSGIWLTNSEPAKCHTHTQVRTPNGNDYGRDLLRQHYAQIHPGRSPGIA